MAVLLSLVEQIVLKSGGTHPSLSSQVHRGASSPTLGRAQTREAKGPQGAPDTAVDTNPNGAQDINETKRRLIRKMRLQVFAGAGIGLLIALAM